MAAIKTLDFLPDLFRTNTNKKFLGATLDQLVSEPDFRKINGYVGRRFAPTFKAGDNYIPEPNDDRQNYQLESSVVVEDRANNSIDHFSGYIDLIQKLGYYGGITNNHSRLFSEESYSYDGLFDFDKFVNFNNYYWLPDGPDAVEVFAGTVDNQATYTVDRNIAAKGYNFSGSALEANPVITLARGGVYQFVVNQPGNPFWIQAEPGVTGTKAHQPNISTREVFGVKNNGIDVGTITFRVPLVTAQDRYSKMQLIANADYATTLSYTQVQNRSLSELLAVSPTGIDGINGKENLNNKLIIFVNSDIDNTLWTTPGTGEIVPVADRRSVWKLTIDDNNIIRLEKSYVVAQDQKVFVRSGNTSGTLEYYVNYNGVYSVVPLVTSTADRLFYQDANQSGLVGEIKIVDQNNHTIDVDNDIIGKKSYTSPNGVKFTNGLKIRFDNKVAQTLYANNEYYVDGVGSAIKLIAVDSLSTPEAYASNGLTVADYITINRGSIDQNGWSRSNRWFHIDVINATAGYNQTTSLPDQDQRANRPIIEFESDMQLINFGRVAKHPVDIIDVTITDAFTQIEGATGATLGDVRVGGFSCLQGDTSLQTTQLHGIAQGMLVQGPGISGTATVTSVDTTIDSNGVVHYKINLDRTLSQTITSVDLFTFGKVLTPLVDGMRIVFSAEQDYLINNKIYVVKFIRLSAGATPTIHLVEAEDSTILPYNNIIVMEGSNKGSTYWVDSAGKWNLAQAKTGVNQSPLFDVFDNTGVSYSDSSKYSNTSFAGSKVFSYKVGTGTNDTILGFPLSYKNFNSVGDIEFINNFDNDVVTYLSGQDTLSIPTNNGTVRKNFDIETYESKNVWTKVKEPSKQYQIISTVYTGKTNWFEIDILPEVETELSYTKVYLNNNLLNSSQYGIKKFGNTNAVVINLSLLTVNDKIDIVIYSKTTSQIGYYEIPDNLEFNPLNESFSSMTLGQLRNHVKIIQENSKLINNYAGRFSSLRDIEYKSNGGSIVQHGSPLIYSNIFLNDPTLNFVDSLSFASKEYTKFKNKFVELSTKLDGISSDDIPGSVDLIIKNISAVKNKSFPWYYSDMVPYGDNKNTIVYTIINPDAKQYEITTVFNDTELSNKAILVYLNGQQLVKGKDYYFPQDRAAVILNDSVTLNADDILTINEYQNTDGCYIPETPSKLGLYPLFRPSIYLDNTYREPVNVIEGHDGSVTPAFGDYRDDLLLELEKRIYNNVKINYQKNIFDLYNYVPGKFRDSDYSLSEFNQVLTKTFLKWVGFNRVDFTTNSYFKSGDAWTWNYKRIPDSIDGETLPGAWRAIYNYWFDTDRPHTHPWEMLGFSEEPSWWEDRYGAAPYTGGNTLMWTDLSKGYIYAGDRAGYDARFVRPTLLNHIPVDEYGELISPEKFAVRSFDSQSVNASYSVGDQGPVETVWRRSSDFPFAMQQALALIKPAYYFGSLVNVNTYYRNTAVDQLVRSDTGQRITPTSIAINGDTTSGTTVRCAGYLNWIRDYVQNLGIDATGKIRGYLDNLDVRLGYKVAGYTDKRYIKVLAEQSSPTSTNNSIIIPDENYKIHLHKSTPIKKATYSAVIVERSENGYTVSGYDTSAPYFTIIPSEVNNNSYAINIINSRGIIYRDYQPRKVTVPYGYEFTSKQQVVDFLVSYGRFLVGSGFVFDEQDNNLKQRKDWVLSATEFLAWSQQGWKPGNIIVLSPTYNSIKFNHNSGVVDHIKNTSSTSKVLDQNYNIIKNTQFSVVRDDNQFTLVTLDNQTICLAELDVVQYEHSLIFDNTTVFSDVIYAPELGNRQYRLKIVGNKTGAWTGNLNPPGFIYNSPTVDQWRPGVDYRKGAIVSYKEQYYTALSNIIANSEFVQKQWELIDRASIKTGLLPNFAYNAQKFENIYDVDNQPVDSGLDAYSNGIIGFRNRDYLNDFSLDQVSQVKFYQGYIKEKGTLNAIKGLTHAAFNNVTSDINIYEEWAVRVGEYGAIESDQVVEIPLSDAKFKNDPSALALLDTSDASPGIGINGIYYNDLYRKPDTYKKDIFFNRDNTSTYTNDILTAGYVNIDDVNGTIFNFGAYSLLDNNLDKIGKGYKLWVANDFTNTSWNVYRANETNNIITSLEYNLDTVMTVNFETAHNLTVGQIFVIKNFDGRFDGFYQVLEVLGINSITAYMHKNEDVLKAAVTISGSGVYYTLDSVRVDKPTDIANITPVHGWMDGDRVWVDNHTGETWAVLEKSSPWDLQDYITPQVSEFSPNFAYGTSVKLSSTKDLAIVGAPGKNEVKTFARLSTGEFIQTATLRPQNDNILNFGSTVDVSDYVVAVGAPATFNNQGCVYVYSVGAAFGFNGQILIDQSGAPGDSFGQSLALSQDNQWLYVGAPGESAVYAYKLVTNVANYRSEITSDGTKTNYNMPFTPVSNYSITVSTNSKRYIPDLEFKVTGGKIYFYAGDGVTAATPPVDTIVVSQGPYYKYMSTLKPNDVGSTDKFGWSLATNFDGSELFVGAPQQTVNGITAAGSVYSYTRRSESFRSRTGINTFVTNETCDDYTVVTVNGTLQFPGTDYIVSTGAIRFNNAPDSGKVVRITQRTFDLAQKLTQPTPAVGSQFGYSVSSNHAGSGVYVGAPYYSEPGYQSGIVYRFADAPMITGFAKGTVTNPVTSPGTDLYINGFRIEFTGTSLADAVKAINDANLPGVFASINSDNTINITRNSSDEVKLQIRDHGSSNVTSLGLPVYAVSQTLRHPNFGRGENFGYRVAVNEEGTALLVSSDSGTTIKDTTLDQDETSMDNNSTHLVDQVATSGAVYQFELLEDTIVDQSDVGTFVYAQQLVSPDINPKDLYGYSIDINGNLALVGSPGNDTHSPEGGLVHLFNNVNMDKSWKVIRQQGDKVDLDSVNRLFVYDSTTNTIINNLDFIDPAKGKVLGIAEQDIDYKTSFDPATYNMVAGYQGQYSTYNMNYHWSDQQVGRVWWDLSKLRFIDYEQSSLTYRLKNWGSIFPGSSIDVYEWVESPVPPSLYASRVGDGQPLYDNDIAYCLVNGADPVTGVIKTKYYFWVKNKKNTAPKGKNNSTSVIADIISNPSQQGVPYAVVMQSNAIGLFNVGRLLKGEDIILHIDYANIKNSNSIHAEFELISENNPDSVIPEKVLNKLIDSLAGIDRLGQIVPDPTLNAVEKLGLNTRPRQSMIANRRAALENFVRYVNGVFALYPITVQYDINSLYAEDPLPDNTQGDEWDNTVTVIEDLAYLNTASLPVGYKVLVTSDSTNSGLWAIYVLNEDKTFVLLKIQSYKTDLYWKKVDWYASDYDTSSNITYLVDTEADIAKLNLVAGNTVKVKYSTNGMFEIYRVNSDLSLTSVGLENGTIELSSNLYNLTAGKMSYDEDNFDNGRYDQTPSYEIRLIIGAIRDNIFIGELKNEFNKLFFVIINYILAEQKTVDWIFKTSFINIVHKLRKLEQFPSFIKDNQDYYLNYVNEVKPYRTQVREYLVDYSGDDLFDGDITDFDLPSYYDSVTNTYRSPNGEQAGDATLFSQSKYSNWRNYHTYVVDSISVDLPGSGFITTPEIVIEGGGGSGAEAYAVVDFGTGQITEIIVTKPGFGYTSTPTVRINPSANGAKAYPLMSNKQVRQFNSTIKFDRVSYSSNVTTWTSNVAYTANTIVGYDGLAWKATANIAALDYFDYTHFTKLNGDQVGTAIDRINAYYTPGTGQAGKDPAQLIAGVEYPGVFVQGLEFSANTDFVANASLIDTFIQSNYADAALGTRPEDINVDGGAYVDRYNSHAPEELVPGIIFDSLNMEVYTRPVFSSNAVADTSTNTGVRIFSNMIHETKYYRIAEASTTTLTANLAIGDTLIHVADASKLPAPGTDASLPGVVFINGEKIHYYTRDLVNNTLGQLRRAVDGTGAPAVHYTTTFDPIANAVVATKVVDSSMAQIVDSAQDTWVAPWSTGNVIVGNVSGMYASTTALAKFLLQSPANRS